MSSIPTSWFCPTCRRETSQSGAVEHFKRLCLECGSEFGHKQAANARKAYRVSGEAGQNAQTARTATHPA